LKKTFVALALLAASSAFAGELSVTGDVGATTNEIYRGQSLSAKHPAVNSGVRADFKGGVVDLFGGVRGSTVNVGGQRGVARAEFGVGMDILSGRGEAGVRENMNFGGMSSDLNTREVFVRGSMPLANGSLTAEYNKQIQGATFGYGKSSYTALGYSMPITGMPMTVGVSVGYAGYSSGTKFNDITVGTSYALTPRVDLLASESIGGKNADGSAIANMTSVGIRYKF
jgi:hypothetical protein